jgi:hypothetical protein
MRVDLGRSPGGPTVFSRIFDKWRLYIGDFFAFEVGTDQDRPEIQGHAMIYDGLGFQVTCTVKRRTGNPSASISGSVERHARRWT